MTVVVMELEEMLTRLRPEAAEKLEMQVREALSSVAETDNVLPTLEEIKLRVPDIAHLIGAWADEDVAAPEELPMPPARVW